MLEAGDLERTDDRAVGIDNDPQRFAANFGLEVGCSKRGQAHPVQEVHIGQIEDAVQPTNAVQTGLYRGRQLRGSSDVNRSPDRHRRQPTHDAEDVERPLRYVTA